MYVVYLTYYKGTKLPPWYIGSSSEKKILNDYTGSVCSKKWKEIYYKELKENRSLFKTRILSYHKTRESAVIEENRLQLKHNVVKSNKYFNETYAIDGCFTRDKTGELNPMFGKGHLVSGKKNGRHKDNFNGNIEELGKNISKGLKNSKKNKKELNPASKKYYVYDSITNSYTDIDKGYLSRFCEIFNLKYTTLYVTLYTQKPVKFHPRWNNFNSVGYQLFEGEYIDKKS